VHTYKLDAVRILILPNEFHNISILHPLRNHRKPAAVYCHTNQRNDIGMAELSPCDSFSTEVLTFLCQCKAVEPEMELTRNTLSRSLVRVKFTTLTATCIPLCMRLKRLAKPPEHSASADPSDKPQTCIDRGSMPFRLQSLVSWLSFSLRSRFDIRDRPRSWNHNRVSFGRDYNTTKLS